MPPIAHGPTELRGSQRPAVVNTRVIIAWAAIPRRARRRYNAKRWSASLMASAGWWRWGCAAIRVYSLRRRARDLRPLFILPPRARPRAYPITGWRSDGSAAVRHRLLAGPQSPMRAQAARWQLDTTAMAKTSGEAGIAVCPNHLSAVAANSFSRARRRPGILSARLRLRSAARALLSCRRIRRHRHAVTRHITSKASLDARHRFLIGA